MKKICYLIFCFISLPFISTAADLDVPRFQDLTSKDENIIIIDVRTPEEYSRGHIPGAVNIDYHNKDFKKAVSGLDKNKTYALYCRTGVRSRSAYHDMKELGFKNLYNLKGGVTAWERDDRPLEK